MTESSSVESSLTPFAFRAVCGVFVTIGGTAALFGPLLSAIATRFHTTLPVAGTSLSSYFVGGLLGMVLGWYLVHHYEGRIAAVSGLLTMTVGGIGVSVAASAHQWALFLLASALMGLGFGILDFTLNTVLARTPEVGRAHRLSFANAFWGIGSIIGPLLIVVIRPHNFPLLFALLGLTTLALSGLLRGMSAPPTNLDEGASNKATQRANRPILLTFIGGMMLYVALEIATSGWLASHVHALGYSQSVGSLVTAGFWLGFTAGRLVGGWLHRFYSAAQLVLGGLGVAVVLSVLALQSTLALVAYPLLGLALANIYVFGIIWYQSFVGTDPRGIAILIIATMVGGIIGPSAISAIVSLTSVRAVPWCLAGIAALTAVVFASSLRFRR